MAVKKLFAILMIMLYAASSTGATVQLHYCCGKLKSIKLSSTPVKDCSNKKMMGTKPCCETKQVSVKNQDQQQVYAVLLSDKAPVELPVFYTEVKPLKVYTYAAEPTVHSSPPLSKSLFLLNCVFRI